jgi:MFS family permease
MLHVDQAGSRTRDALRNPDFVRLLLIRLVSQSADGLIQAALVASLAFSPEKQTTASGFATATAIVILPFSLVGPFAGVFIDRWSRRRIMVIAPLLRAAPVFLVLLSPTKQPILFYAGALWVTSVNRFFLSTAQAVVPRLVPAEDLLAANSIATVGGTVALLVGVFAGGLMSSRFGNGAIVTASSVMWLVAALVATSLRSDLRPHLLPEAPELLRHQIRRVGAEFVEGIGDLGRTPRALGPIVSISVDQIVQGFVLVLALVVFRQRFGEGVGSFSWLIGAGGVGVFLGLLTVGRLALRLERSRIVAWSFVLGGLSLIGVALFLNRWTVLVASFVIGLTYAWKKVPIDTMVQEAVPDGLRGRVFAVYDVATNVSRLLAALLAIPLLPLMGVRGASAFMGLVLLLWAPVLPAWLRRAPVIRLRYPPGEHEVPRAIWWGGVEEPVDVVDSAVRERDGSRVRTLRLALGDGSTMDLSRVEPDGEWVVERRS